MVTHSSILAWRTPGMVEPDGLLSMGSHRVGHNWSDLAAAAAAELELNWGTSLVVQWLGLQVFTAKGVGLIPGQGTKIP